MQPIVNRLEENYQVEIVFDRLDANGEPGRSLMQTYQLRGHPSYVIVDTAGNKLWSASGVLEETLLASTVEQYLAE